MELLATKPQEQANLFNIHLHSVFRKESCGVPSLLVYNIQDDQCADCYTDSVSCNTVKVQMMFQETDTSKSSGVEKIPARLQKETAHLSAVPLSMLYNLSFMKSQVPTL